MAHGTSLYCPCLMVSAGSWDDQERAYGRGAYSDPPGGRQPRSRRRDPASHADVAVTYEAELFVHGGFVMSGVAGVVVGIVALVLGEIQGLIFLFSGGLVGFIGFWMPHRVTLDDSGVLLQAVVRRARIPWEQLKTVEPPLWDLRRDLVKWRRSRGLPVLMPRTFPDLHRMLVEIERRAPHVYVSS
jgi:hypothetical protein